MVVASAAKGEMLLSSTLSRAPSPAFLRFNGAAPICWAVTWSRSSVGNRGGRLSSINSVSSCHGSGTSGVSRAATTMIAKPSQVVVLGATGRLGRRVVRSVITDSVGVVPSVDGVAMMTLLWSTSIRFGSAHFWNCFSTGRSGMRVFILISI